MRGQITHLSDATFHDAVDHSERPVLVDFHADWCGPCHAMAPILEQVAKERDDIVVAKVDVDANPRTADAHGVQSIPTLLVFRDGHVIGSIVGAQPRAAIEAALDEALAPTT